LDFGDELKRIREGKGMTLGQLAAYSGVSAASISRYETGDRGIPKPPTIEKLAKGLKIEYDYMMQIAGYLKDDPKSKEAKRKAAEELLEYLELELTNEEIKERMTFKVDNLTLNNEEMDEFISFVRWQRSKKKEQPAASKSDRS
jgi:transcriptional regulator with XRE-family HTH domain